MYVRTYARSITWQPNEKSLTIFHEYRALSQASFARVGAPLKSTQPTPSRIPLTKLKAMEIPLVDTSIMNIKLVPTKGLRRQWSEVQTLLLQRNAFCKFHLTVGQNRRDHITRRRRSKRVRSNFVLCIPFLLSGSPNEWWLHTCEACAITTWGLGLRAPLVARNKPKTLRCTIITFATGLKVYELIDLKFLRKSLSSDNSLT